MKKRISFWMVVFFIAVAVSFSAQNAFADKTITLSYSIFFPSTHAVCQTSQAWIDEVEKRTNGRVKIKMYPGGSLTPPFQAYSGLKSGISDIAQWVDTYEWGRFPLTHSGTTFIGFKTAACATNIVNEMQEKYKLKEPGKELGEVHMLYTHAHGPAQLHSKIPVRTLDDFKGLKIRTNGPTLGACKALGAIGVTMSQNEVYEAMGKGIVDASFAPFEVLKGYKQAEVAKYTTKLDFIGYTATFLVGINNKKWESLPKDLQDIITAVSKEWPAEHIKTWDRIDDEALKYSLSLGNEIIELSPGDQEKITKLLIPVALEYGKSVDAKGLPGTQFMEDYIKRARECK